MKTTPVASIHPRRGGVAERLARLRMRYDHTLRQSVPHQIYRDTAGVTHRTSRENFSHPGYYACGMPVDERSRVGASRDGLSDFTCAACVNITTTERLECYTAPTHIRIEHTPYGLNFPEDMMFFTRKETLAILSRHRNWLKHRAWVQFSARRHPDLDMPFTTREAIMYWILDEARHLDQQRTAAMMTHKCPNCHILMTEGAIHAVECRYRPAAWSNEPRKL